MSFIIDPYRFGGPVSPDDFPGLVRWYKADSYALTDGDRIGGAGREWIDQSTSAVNAVQASAPAQPLFNTNIFGSLPAIVFVPGDNSWLSMTGLALSGEFTMIAIAKASANTIALGSTTLNIWFRIHVSSVVMDYYDGTDNMVSNTLLSPANAARMLTWRRSGAALHSFREQNASRGDFVAAGGMVSQTWSEIGGTLGSGGGNASLGELCIYNTRLSDTDIDSLYANYFNRWGVP